MVEALFEELASAGGTETVLAAGAHLAKKMKSSHDIKKLFVETGKFFVDFEPQAEQLFEDMALVLSKENMTKLANELKCDSGYTLKNRLLDSIMSLMDKYDIPREYAMLYANRILYAILGQLPEVVPRQYDRYFQSEWREEQEATLTEIKQKIDKVNNQLDFYKSRSISIESADQLDIKIRRQTSNPRIGIEFFDIDDDNFKDAFEDQKKEEIVRVRAKCREEAVYCIVNELWRSNEKRAIFIVKCIEDWDKLSQSSSVGNIYIPWFWNEEICAIENNTNIFIYTDGVPSFSNNEIILRPRTFRTICNALVKAGLGLNDANALVNETHAVMLTAHDKFNDILAEAQKGDSIFKVGNVIKAENLAEPEEITYTQLTVDNESDQELQSAYEKTGVTESEENDELLQTAMVYLQEKTEEYISASPIFAAPTQPDKRKIVQAVKSKIEEDQDLGKTFKDNENPFLAWLEEETEQVYNTIIGKYIPIPRICVTDAGVEQYVFIDFDLDLSEFIHVPIKNELLIQNLEDMSDRQRIKSDAIDFEGYNPKKVILAELRKKPEIDYERCSALLFKLITQVCDHYESIYGINGMQNIVMMYRRDLANKIYSQMMKNFYYENGFLQEIVIDVKRSNLRQSLGFKQRVGLYHDFVGDIHSVLFEGIKKGVFAEAKFDSKEGELTLARVLDRDEDVLKWLRPAPNEFNITYNRGKRYEPDFVVETADCCYLIEVKAEKDMCDPDVIAKKKRGIQYCEVATRWCKANGYKPWEYLFIPAKQVLANSSFRRLAEQFKKK